MKNKLNKLVEDSRKILSFYAIGAIAFFIGAGLIQFGANAMPPSIQQELMVLLGIIIGGLGFGLAMLAQCGLIIHRFQKLGKPSPSNDKKG